VPIHALGAGAERIGRGDLTQRISIRTGDELEVLAHQFNDMAGRLQTSQLLQVIFDDPEFAWLRSMSGLIVRIDEALEAKEGEVDETGPLIAQVRELVSPAPDSPYAHRYHAALQELPDAVLAHGALLTALKLQRPQSRA